MKQDSDRGNHWTDEQPQETSGGATADAGSREVQDGCTHLGDALCDECLAELRADFAQWLAARQQRSDEKSREAFMAGFATARNLPHLAAEVAWETSTLKRSASPGAPTPDGGD